jgi:hypothetical protein
MTEALKSKGCGAFALNCPKFLLCGMVLMVAIETSSAAPPISTDSPICFFTNVAACLLSSEMNLNSTQIEIYPINQYTPAVHRLLQVTANIYDASTNSYFPSVFRPLFTRDQGGLGTNLYVSGYACVPFVTGAGDPQLAMPVDAAALATISDPVINLATNVYGVPWIIGVKKGFPNFNEFVEEDIVGVTLRLQMMRDTNSEVLHYPKVYLTKTNQMYLFSINSSIGLDFWNSYKSNLTDNVTVVYRGITWLTITNDDPGFNSHPGVGQPMGFAYANTNYIGPLYASYWPGSSPWGNAEPNGSGQPNPGSFFTPLNVIAYPVLTNSVYRTSYAYLTPGTLAGFTGPCLIPTNYFGSLGMTMLFETNTPGFPLPHFGLVSTNRLQVFILDGTNGSYNVIDYAHFEQNSSRFLNSEIFTDDPDGVMYPSHNVGVWNTNIDLVRGVPYGIENQIGISRGLDRIGVSVGEPPAEDGVWQPDSQAMQYGTFIPAQQALFLAFFQPYGTVAHISDSYGLASASNIQASVIAPYAPTRFAVGYTILQANDPLVHYLASDLALSLPAGLLDLPFNYNNSITNVPTPAYFNLGALNYNYQPWLGNPSWNNPGLDTNAYNLAERDPLVTQPDNWNFPNGPAFNADWLGQVHRGTPWQTIYLKATDILASSNGLAVWENWTGDADATDAMAMAPVRDWHLAGLLASLFNTNSVQSLFSVNNPDPNAWTVLLNGLTAWENTLPGQYDPVIISSNSPQALVIANAIQSARINQPGQSFADIGDILATPQLAEQSPFLNSNTNINDEAYEMIPSQLLSLLRMDSVGSVAAANGQAVVQFTGSDGHSYAIEFSPDLVNWTRISTNWPAGDVFNFTISPPLNATAQFYRSVMLK